MVVARRTAERMWSRLCSSPTARRSRGSWRRRARPRREARASPPRCTSAERRSSATRSASSSRVSRSRGTFSWTAACAHPADPDRGRARRGVAIARGASRSLERPGVQRARVVAVVRAIVIVAERRHRRARDRDRRRAWSSSCACTWPRAWRRRRGGGSRRRGRRARSRGERAALRPARPARDVARDLGDPLGDAGLTRPRPSRRWPMAMGRRRCDRRRDIGERATSSSCAHLPLAPGPAKQTTGSGAVGGGRSRP